MQSLFKLISNYNAPYQIVFKALFSKKLEVLRVFSVFSSQLICHVVRDIHSLFVLSYLFKKIFDANIYEGKR